MKPDPLSDEKILDSWHRNALPWTHAVRHRQIESRRQITDTAIVEAVLSRSPRSVLDIGCGEGWLARELSVRDIHVTGIDAVAELVEQARNAGGGDFHVLSYEQLAAGDTGLMADMVVLQFFHDWQGVHRSAVQCYSPAAQAWGLLRRTDIAPGDELWRSALCGWLAFWIMGRVQC